MNENAEKSGPGPINIGELGAVSRPKNTNCSPAVATKSSVASKLTAVSEITGAPKRERRVDSQQITAFERFEAQSPAMRTLVANGAVSQFL